MYKIKIILTIIVLFFFTELFSTPKVQSGISNINNTIIIKARSNENIQTGILTACIITIKYLTSYNISISNDSSLYGIQLITSMTNGNYTYKFFGTASGNTQFNWLTNVQYEILRFRIIGGVGNGNFEIANDNFTINNNGEYYIEHNVFGDITNHDVPFFNQNVSGVPLPIINIEQKSVETERFEAYPNPFNLNTILEFKLTKTSFVEIFLVNYLGQQIYTIKYDLLNPSLYKLQINGLNLSSGVYYAILSTNYSNFTKKLILIK
jgi:hypothetical protein